MRLVSTFLAALILVCYQTSNNIVHAADAAGKATTSNLPTRLTTLKAATLKHMVFVPGGTFTMGDFGPIHNEEKLPYSSATDDDVLHKVTLDSFSISAYKVTYADFDVFTDSTGRSRVAQDELDLEYRDLPGVPAGVNWYDAQAYCQWLGKQLSLSMDLPTEAQWEYAARNAGKMVVYATDNGKIDNGRNVPNLEQFYAFDIKESGIRFLPISKYPPTPLGLYDMATGGNEWVRDWYAPSYEASPAKNPTGPANGTDKVKRSYASEGGDNLQFTSMTFTRNKAPPKALPPTKSLLGHRRTDNPNAGDSLRCVANVPKKLN